MPDYIAMRLAEEDDAEHYGVKGQRWGVSRSSRELRSAAKVNPPKHQVAKKEEPAKAAASSAPAKKPGGDIQDHVESSSARYDRLAGQAKAGRASDMTEQDLKFFNARTEALSKVAKLIEVQPSWLRETTTKVIQQSAQRQMQTIADSMLDKYVGNPLKEALGAKAADAVAKSATTKAAAVAKSTNKTDPSAVTSSAVKAAAKKVAETAKTTPSTSSAPNPSTMRFADALKYYADNPTATPKVPDGYSKSAAQVFLDEVAKLRKS